METTAPEETEINPEHAFRIKEMQRVIPGFKNLSHEEQLNLVSSHIFITGVGFDPDTKIGFSELIRCENGKPVDRILFSFRGGSSSHKNSFTWLFHNGANDGSAIREIALKLLHAEGLSEEEIYDILFDMGEIVQGDLPNYIACKKAVQKKKVERETRNQNMEEIKPVQEDHLEDSASATPNEKHKESSSVSEETSENNLESFAGSSAPSQEASTKTAPIELKPPESAPCNETPIPPIKREWQRAKVIFDWIKQHAPALVVGGLTGAGVRIAAQFALAAFVTTTPGIAAAIGSAMAIGALAGGLSKLVTTSIWSDTKKDDKHWRRKAFLQGAAMGAIGAGIGAGVAHWLISHDYLHSWFGSKGTPPSEVHGTVPQSDHTIPSSTDHGHVPPEGKTPAQTTFPPHGNEVTPKHVVPSPEHGVGSSSSSDVPSPHATKVPTDTPATHTSAPSGDGSTHAAAPLAGTEHTTPPSHNDTPPVKAPEAPAHQQLPSQEPPSSSHQDPHSTPPADTTPPVVPQGSVRDILTEEQFKKLPRGVQRLALSKNPREIALFCKEASFKLINSPHRSPEALKAGAKLIEHGLEVAKSTGLDNSVTKMLHADLSYLRAWGIGTDKNVEIAIKHAQQAGTAINNYGGRLLKLLGRLTQG
ncbi:MAG: hypothetical protein HGA87_03470 [Desulfobulbaceae bacterium]|nr:hypothetical protein [Desulfobulbaceae bacterium]